VIVDVHVHLLDPRTDLDEHFIAASGHAKAGGGVAFSLGWSDYTKTAPVDTVAIVFGGKARLSGIWVDDTKVAEFVADLPDTTVGFLAVDPTQPGWEDELRYSHLQLGLRGIKIMPMYAGFDPTDSACDALWRYASDFNLPVISHTGTTFVAQAVLDYARPGLFDGVARRFPELKLVLAHLGHPYEGECLATIRKNPNVYADISALHYRPFQLWHSLMLAQDYGVGHKILFGSDFPFTTVSATLEGLDALGKVEIAGLGKLDAAFLQGIVEQDALSLLGIR
jgi:predicted TIM-barrel fold metal-dependent hydrolase